MNTKLTDTAIAKLQAAVLRKLAAEGLTLASPWCEIEACLAQVVSPTACIKAAVSLRRLEMISNRIEGACATLKIRCRVLETYQNGASTVTVIFLVPPYSVPKLEEEIALLLGVPVTINDMEHAHEAQLH